MRSDPDGSAQRPKYIERGEETEYRQEYPNADADSGKFLNQIGLSCTPWHLSCIAISTTI